VTARKVTLIALLPLLAVASAAVLALGTKRSPSPATPTAASAGYRGSGLPAGLRMPAFRLHDLDGHSVTSQQLRGHAVIVAFFDSRCRSACPVIAAQLAVALDGLSPSERSHLITLAISMNPRSDTPASARAFLRQHWLLGRVGYLIGSVTQMRPVWRSFHVLSTLQSGNADVHSDDLRVYDPTGRWVSDFSEGVDLTPENIVHDVRLALARG
jgi:cytochrome oxidase Cu insertion factor (SCO1/SenC/PrrC family)